MRIWIASLLLALSMSVQAFEPAPLRVRVEAFGIALDHWLDTAPANAVLEVDPALMALMEVEGENLDDDESTILDYLHWQICQQPAAETFQLVQQWSVRLRRLSAHPTESDADEFDELEMAEFRRAMPIFGMQTSVLLAYVGANYQSCPQASIKLLDYAQQMPAGPDFGDPELTRLRFELTRLGVALQAASGTVRTRDVVQLLEKIEALPIPADLLADEGEMDPIDQYLQALREVASGTQTPLWRVDRTQAMAKIEQQRYSCGMGWMGEVFQQLIYPAWPNEALLLKAEGMGEAAVAYALADLFGTRTGPNSQLYYDQAELVWQVMGKARTRDELQAAASGIQMLQVRDSTIAIASVFGHEFLITSGTQERNAEHPVWFDRKQIEASFRKSPQFLALWGED